MALTTILRLHGQSLGVRGFLRTPVGAGGSVGLLVALGGCGGCSLVGDYQNFDPPRGPMGSCEHHATRAVSPLGRGADMVRVDYPRNQGSCFWIDEREVTVADYSAFVASAQRAPEPFAWAEVEDARCDAKVGAPGMPEPPALGGEAGAGVDAGSFSPVEACVLAAGVESTQWLDELPIRCIDWCEAMAYCRWAGKRLCSSHPGAEREPSWACAGGDDAVAPYPEGECNLSRNTCLSNFRPCVGVQAATGPSGCRAPCGATHLLGNVAEWASGPLDTCLAVGGSYLSERDTSCSSSLLPLPCESLREDVGLRCCADPATSTGN